MRERLRYSFRMMRRSVDVLRAQPQLVLFPILSAIGLMLILTLLLWGTLIAVDYNLAVLQAQPFWVKLLAVFVLYLIAYLVAFFANTGLVGAVMIYLDGGDPTLEDSLHIALSRADKLIFYALIMASIGTFFRWLGRYVGVAGRLSSPILRRMLVFLVVGVAWNLVTYLVVPILVVDGIGPVKALQRSAGLIKKTWGEQVVAYISTGLLFWLFFIPWTLAGGAAISWAVNTMREPLIVLTLYVYVMVPLTLFLVKLSIDSVFCAVVYRFVTEQPLAEFDEELLHHAFRAKPASLVGRVRSHLN